RPLSRRRPGHALRALAASDSDSHAQAQADAGGVPVPVPVRLALGVSVGVAERLTIPERVAVRTYDLLPEAIVLAAAVGLVVAGRATGGGGPRWRTWAAVVGALLAMLAAVARGA